MNAKGSQVPKPANSWGGGVHTPWAKESRKKETRATVKPGPSRLKSMKDEARERSTVNLRAEADGHESAILSPAQDAGLRVPAPLSALGVEVCAAEGDEGGLPPADP